MCINISVSTIWDLIAGEHRPHHERKLVHTSIIWFVASVPNLNATVWSLNEHRIQVGFINLDAWDFPNIYSFNCVSSLSYIKHEHDSDKCHFANQFSDRWLPSILHCRLFFFVKSL
jgi:hypothetical protein